jgi:NTE family protein
VRGFDFRQGELEVSLTGDTLDNLGFPTSGWNGFAYLMASRDSLGANEDFEQGGIGFLGAGTWGANSLNLGMRYRGTLDDDAPIQNLFRTGGFLNLSGLNQNQLSGQHEGLLRLSYLRSLGTKLVPTYLGASLEWGGAWQNREAVGLDRTLFAGSVFLGADTFLGPLYGAYGHAEGGENALYLFLGKPWRLRR